MKRLTDILSTEPAIRVTAPVRASDGTASGSVRGCRRSVAGARFKQTYPWERGANARDAADDICELRQRTRKH